ncbi:MAG: substrate-binding domain-containing protein [Bacteroidetes bacterium]|nr:substrate-binding domain-containing protein [Bacteroidota bacterium]
MTKFFLHTFLVLLLFSFSLYSGCDFDKIKSKAITGNLDIDVDENVEPLMNKEKEEFERLNPEAKLFLHSLPTTNCIANLINGKSKTIISTRDFTVEEKKIIADSKLEFKKYEFAIDGIAFIVNPKNPVLRVTSEDLKKIFTGEFKNWTDIKAQNETQNSETKSFFGGSKGNIKLFIQRQNSSINSYVKDSILQKMDYSSAAVVCSTSTQMLREIRENTNAIGIVSMAWLSAGNQDSLDATVKALRISKIEASGFQRDFVQFHQGYLANGSYPYRRYVYLITGDAGINLTTGFLSFLLKADGQKVVVKNGLVPVSQPVQTIQLN